MLQNARRTAHISRSSDSIAACLSALLLAASSIGCGGAPRVHKLDAVVVAPRFISGEGPIYSQQALDAGVQGRTTLDCLMSPAGEILDCIVLKPLPRVDMATVDALKTWKFSPVELDGPPRNTVWRIELEVQPPRPGETGGPIGAEAAPRGEARLLSLVMQNGPPTVTRPNFISGGNPVYSEEACAVGVEGMHIVRCVIDKDGTISDCQTMKGLPYMGRAVLTALEEAQVEPVTLNGVPVKVSYVFNLRIAAPARCKRPRVRE